MRDSEIKQSMVDFIENDKIVTVTLDNGIWCSVDVIDDIMDDSFFGIDKDGEEEEYYFSEVVELVSI